MFEKGDMLVYGKSGVCVVDDICEVSFGIQGLCYKLRPYEDNQNVIYVSVDNDKVMMRKVITAEKAREIIDTIDKYEAVFPRNDKERADLVKETLDSDDMTKWMELLKGLYYEREKRLRFKKTLKYKDEKVFNFLENFIMGELSVALDIPKYKIYDEIAEILKKNRPKKEHKKAEDSEETEVSDDAETDEETDIEE